MGMSCKSGSSNTKKMKIGPKTMDCIFIGYAHNSNAYRFLVHESENPDVHKNTIMKSNNASFFENMFSCKSKDGSSSSKRTYDNMNEESHDSEDEQGVQTESRRSKRTRVEKFLGPKFLSSEGLLWKTTIKSEVDSILQNHTWELVNLPSGCKPLGSKWIFKRKMKADGSIDKYKARLVIKCYTYKMLYKIKH